MNSTQITNVVPPAVDGESTASGERHPVQQLTRRVLSAAPLRYTLLVGIALVLTSLTWVVLDSIREMEAEIETIHTRVAAMPLQ